MLNAIWAGMIVLGILYGAFTGNLEAVSNAALESAGEAVDLCITMCGIMGLWTGLMKIAQQAGLIAALTRGISPFVSFLFPRIPKNHPARESISTNIVANVLGLGWAATPAGLKAMEDLAQLEEKRRQTGYLKNVPKDTASNEMYVSDFKYFVSAADSGQHDRLSQPVRKRQSRRSGRSCGAGDTCQYVCGSDFLQGDGSEIDC